MPSHSNYDIEIERLDEQSVLYTPLSHEAEDWCRNNLPTVPRWGRSYLLPEGRGAPLRSYLVRERGFEIKCSLTFTPRSQRTK